jgi:hypothetical protein
MITKDEFEDLMNESFPQVEVMLGRLKYGRGTIIRKVDPVQFDIEYYDYLHYLEIQEEMQ